MATMKSSSYTSALIEYARYVKDKTNKLKSEGKIKKIVTPYIKEKFLSFSYKEGNVSYNSSFEEINKEEFDWRSFTEVEDEFKKDKIYLNLLEILNKTFNKENVQLEFYLSRFINTLVREIMNDASDDRIIELAISFIKDLEKSPILWNPLIWLQGIWLIDEDIKIGTNIVLKKPSEKELSKEYNLQTFPYLVGMGMPRNYPSSILEISLRVKTRQEVTNEINKLIIALKLFKVGSIRSTRTEWRSDSILQFGGVSSSFRDFGTPYKYGISSKDTSHLEKFLNIICPIIPRNLIQPGSGQIDYTVIAIQRYDDSILKPEPVESRLSFAIMGLESLFLKENERDELQHRLSQRLAKILSLCGSQPLEVYNNLKRSYDIRSSFVHGSPIPAERLKEASKLAEKIIEYTRISILLFLQLKNIMEKDKLLSLIDNSLLHVNAQDKLDQILKDNCTVRAGDDNSLT